MEKIKEALKRFQAVVESLECECDEYEGYTCTVHSDRVLAEAALIESDAILTPAAPDAEGRCENCNWWNVNREFNFCPDCGKKLPPQ